ncbi:mitochondrial glycoprotein [Pyronema omphalodes]|nr:mitochondrial glycoprotein [Pyronema omphalodes]
MFAARAFTRALRTPATARFVSAIPKRSVLTSLVRQPRIASFSTTQRVFNRAGLVDEELALKLESEYKLESEVEGFDEVPASVKEFLETSEFKVVDKPGAEEVEFVRKFGDETIRVMFSISDLNSMPDPSELDEYSNAYGEPESSQTPAKDESEDNAESYEDADEPSFPVRVNITIEKSNKGALQVEAMAQDGMIVVENVFYHKNAALATSQTVEADWERRGVYGGPPFGNLDEDLQVLFERYLDERGINTSLALVIPDYIDFKEQKEYLSWLQNVKGFVSA